MSNFLQNVFTKGTQALIILGRLIHLPVNEDYPLIGKITAYDADKGKVTLEKIWDQAGTKESFYAWAKYAGRAGTPKSSEVDIDSYVPFYRAGCGNVGFTSTPTGFQLQDSEASEKASFVVFFF